MSADAGGGPGTAEPSPEAGARAGVEGATTRRPACSGSARRAGLPHVRAGARRRPRCAQPPASRRPAARGRHRAPALPASRSSRAAAAAGAGSPWRGRAPGRLPAPRLRSSARPAARLLCARPCRPPPAAPPPPAPLRARPPAVRRAARHRLRGAGSRASGTGSALAPPRRPRLAPPPPAPPRLKGRRVPSARRLTRVVCLPAFGRFPEL